LKEFFNKNKTEERTVVSVAGNKITLNAPLNFTHWGEGYEKAEVGLLTRNFVFQGDASSKDTKLGGHIIIRPAARARFQGVEFTLMGQMGALGRYPVKQKFKFNLKDSLPLDW
jgi:hypothetical protein